MEKKEVDSYEDSKKFFDNLSDVVKNEMKVNLNELELLESMNNLTKKKYEKMMGNMHGLDSTLREINKEYKNVVPILKEIDEVAENVKKLKTRMEYLNKYVKQLEQELGPYLK